jgi:hypothetical protein
MFIRSEWHETISYVRNVFIPTLLREFGNLRSHL